MNINQVSKLFSDLSSQEVKTLELRVGQVVRGVVTQQLPNQEALVNINGVQVKAKLEIPILEGQATLMQVAPDSKGSFIHLKQVDPIALGLQDPMKDIIKAMNLPDKEWTNQLVRELRQEGFPLNRDTLQALAQAAKERPVHVDLEGWMQAAAQAFKRGMPMTAASISAMHQLTQGTPLHQLVSQLQQQLTQLLQAQAGQMSSQSAQLLQQLTQSLSQLMQGQIQQLNQVQGQTAQTSYAQGQSRLATQGQQNSTQASLGQAATASAASLGQQVPTNNIQNPIVSFMRMLGVQHENMLSQQLLKGEHMQAGQMQAGQMRAGQTQMQVNLIQQQALQPQGTFNGTTQMAANAAAQGQATVQTAVNQVLQHPTQSSNITPNQTATAPNQAQSNSMQQAQAGNTTSSGGINQQALAASEQQTAPNQQLLGQSAQSQAAAAVQGQHAAQQTASSQAAGQSSMHTVLQNQAEPFTAQPSVQALNNSLNQASDSIKATVLNLLQMSDVPVTAKETLAQLLNHITGQQMMLAAERNHSMFTHITMYIPIKDNQGGQTAAIHVQTRRDRKGQLDAENCRIVFDLDMKQLGQTLVDMNVTNKIVSLNVWNDSSFMQNLLDSMRPEIVEAMQKTGYSLSSIKATPFNKEENDSEDEVKAIIQPPHIQQLNVTKYKGVDFKI